MTRQAVIDGINQGDGASKDWERDMFDEAILHLAKTNPSFTGDQVLPTVLLMNPDIDKEQMNFYGVGGALLRAKRQGVIDKVTDLATPKSKYNHMNTVVEWRSNIY